VKAGRTAQSIVDYVWTQAGRTHPPKVVAISKTATRSVATANRLRIRIPRHGIKTTVLLHEVAHSMTGDIDKPGDHGVAFAGTLAHTDVSAGRANAHRRTGRCRL